MASPPTSRWLLPSDAPATRAATVSAALVPLVMTAAWLIAEAVQPPSYSPLGSSISGLAALGAADRWIVTGALFLVGACYFVTAACLPGVRRPARIVLLIAGLSSVGIAAAPEPVHGSSPQHIAWTSIGAVAVAIWPAFAASREPAAPLIQRPGCAAVVTVVSLALLAWLVAETQHGTVLGLAERLVSGLQVTWPFIVIVAQRRLTFRTKGQIRSFERTVALPGWQRRATTPRGQPG